MFSLSFSRFFVLSLVVVKNRNAKFLPPLALRPQMLSNRNLMAALLLAAARATTTIDNLSPRRDITGAVMDAHDFSLHRVPGDAHYYMTAIAYGGCMEPKARGCDGTPDDCGFQQNHTINVWRSLDLSSGSWELVTSILEAQRPPGLFYREFALRDHACPRVHCFGVRRSRARASSNHRRQRTQGRTVSGIRTPARGFSGLPRTATSPSPRPRLRARTRWRAGA